MNMNGVAPSALILADALTSYAHARDGVDNPLSPIDGHGTNWENPPGPIGGRGTSPNINASH